jgi:hypothetical protein
MSLADRWDEYFISAPPRPPSPPLDLLRGYEHPVVAFMAGDLEELAIGPVHRDLDGPRFAEHRRILDRGLIRHRALVGAREALDDAQVLVAETVQIDSPEDTSTDSSDACLSGVDFLQHAICLVNGLQGLADAATVDRDGAIL